MTFKIRNLTPLGCFSGLHPAPRCSFKLRIKLLRNLQVAFIPDRSSIFFWNIIFSGATGSGLVVRKLIQSKSRQSKLIQGKLKIIPDLIFRIPDNWSGKILKVIPLHCRSPWAKMNSVRVTQWSSVLNLSSQIIQVWIFFLEFVLAILDTFCFLSSDLTS